MIKYQSNYDEPGIHILPHRFHCTLTKEDKAYQEGKDYRLLLEIGAIIGLVLLIFSFQAWKQTRAKERKAEPMQLTIQIDDIPQTVQERIAPAPARPSVPIASEDEDIPDDETIEFTDLDLEEIPPPPPPLAPQVDEDTPIFIPYDEPPEPIGGLQAIMENLEYPEIARVSGIEGITILYLLIDEKGDLQNIKIAKSMGFDVCDQAAIEAVKKVRWKPAMQRDMPVKVWFGVPIAFQLRQ